MGLHATQGADRRPAPGAGPSNTPSLSEFSLIPERNIFNPTRGPRQARTEQSPAPAERPPRTESLALRGTLSYDKGRFAVFGGSEPEFRKVLKVSDSVAGLKIRDVGADHVDLEREGKQIRLKVGMQMERKEQGDWDVTGAASAPEMRPVLASNTNRAEASPESDDILKRLLEKREQELQNEKK